MENIELIVIDSKLPNQLKEYFISSKSMKKVITESVLYEIEELYIFYQSLYIFDTSEFSAYTITSLKRNKNWESFYYYLKKVIDSNLDLVSKDKSFDRSRDDLYLNKKAVDTVLKENIYQFCNLIENIYKENEHINIKETYKSLGKIELINSVFYDEPYKNILDKGIKILEKYEEPNR